MDRGESLVLRRRAEARSAPACFLSSWRRHAFTHRRYTCKEQAVEHQGGGGGEGRVAKARRSGSCAGTRRQHTVHGTWPTAPPATRRTCRIAHRISSLANQWRPSSQLVRPQPRRHGAAGRVRKRASITQVICSRGATPRAAYQPHTQGGRK